MLLRRKSYVCVTCFDMYYEPLCRVSYIELFFVMLFCVILCFWMNSWLELSRHQRLHVRANLESSLLRCCLLFESDLVFLSRLCGMRMTISHPESYTFLMNEGAGMTLRYMVPGNFSCFISSYHESLLLLLRFYSALGMKLGEVKNLIWNLGGSNLLCTYNKSEEDVFLYSSLGYCNKNTTK